MKTLVSAAMFAVLTTTAIAESITIFISGNRSETLGLGIPAATTIISANDIEKSGASNLYELFSTVNGIQVSDSSSGGGNANIDMRGFGETSQSNVAILINNQKINTTTDATVWNLHAINVDNIERIEIIRGSSGVLYGSQAVGGLINIITKDVVGDNTSIKQSLGSYNAIETSIDLIRSFKNIGSVDNLRTQINAYKKKSDGYRDNNTLEVERLDLGVKFDQGNNITTLNLQSLHDHLQTPGALNAIELAANRRQAIADHQGDFTENKTLTISGSHKKTLTSSTEAKASFKYQTVNRTFRTGFRGWPANSNSTQDKWTFEINPHLTTSSKFGITSYGLDLNSSNYTLSSGQGNAQQIYAAYIQHQTELTQKLNMTTGLRYSKVFNDLYNSFSTPTSAKPSNAFFVKSLGFSFSPKDKLNLFARVDENFRFAKVDEHTNSFEGVGNATGISLKDQNGRSFEFGVDYKLNKFSFSTALSRLKLENEITSTLQNGFAENLNLDQSTKDSLSLESSFTLKKNLKLILGAEFIDAQITSGPYAGNKTPSVSDRTFSLKTLWSQKQNLVHSLSAKWTGDQYLTSDFTNTNPKLSAFKVINYNLSHKIENWDLNFKVENLTNEQYISFGAGSGAALGYYPAPERNFMISAKYTFE